MNSKQSKICIVTTRNIFDSPCIDKYRKLFNESFDIIYWDRCEITEECGAANYFKYDGPLDADAGKLKKLLTYIGFFLFANRILKENTYSKLIVFPTQMGWLIQGRLCHKYKGKYVLDIRDYAGENNPIIYRMTKKIVDNAGICSITSPAYQEFLPHTDYVISHNIQPIDKDLVQKYRMRERCKDQPIVLSFIGSVRFIEQQKKIISTFKNDSRFQLRFIGRGSEQLADFCRNENIENVTLIGRFERVELANFYLETDMAINIYGNHNPYLDYALSNKLYSAAMMGMPILVSPETYMEDIVKQYRLGLSVDLSDKQCADRVYEYYKNCNQKELQIACNCFLESVERDEKYFTESVKQFFGEI